MILFVLLVVIGAPALGLFLGRHIFDGGWQERYQCENCGKISTFQYEVGGYGGVCKRCGEHGHPKVITARPTGYTGWKVKE